MAQGPIGNIPAPPKRLVATVGNFDGVHRGHLHLIERVKREARKRGLTSAVITFTNHPSSVLHPERPVQLLWDMDGEEKKRALAATGVDRIIWLTFTPAMATMSSTQFVEWLRREHGADVLVMGYNHTLGHDRGANLRAAATPQGIEIVEADEYRGEGAPVSSSIIRDLIAQGDVREAAHKWGRPVTLEGTVIDGHKNGRVLGFPTANIRHRDGQLWPPTGAYVARVTILLPDGSAQGPFGGMVGITRRPTITGVEAGTVGAEVHLFDFDCDIYGHEVCIELLDYLRPERHFASVAELQCQLTADRDASLAILARHGLVYSEKTIFNHNQ